MIKTKIEREKTGKQLITRIFSKPKKNNETKSDLLGLDDFESGSCYGNEAINDWSKPGGVNK